MAVPSADHRTWDELYRLGWTDERGNFLLRGVNPGEYTILAFQVFPMDLKEPAVIKEYEGSGENVTVGEGARKSVTLKVIRGMS